MAIPLEKDIANYLDNERLFTKDSMNWFAKTTLKLSNRRSARHLVACGVIFAIISLTSCCSGPKCKTDPSASTGRPLSAMCVIHVDAVSPNVISLNSKVFTAERNSTISSTGFGDFRLVRGPFGDSSLASTNLDALPSVYAISESWFRGLSINESVRAQVIPSLRTNPNGQPLGGETGSGTGARWNVISQDSTGAYRGVSQARNSTYALDQVADNNANTVPNYRSG